MTQHELEVVVENTLDQVRDLLVVKGREYVRNEDPFHNFEVGSRMTGLIREKVLDGFLLKHEISIADITNDIEQGKLPSVEKLDEKILDNIVYLLLKKAMILDRIDNQ